MNVYEILEDGVTKTIKAESMNDAVANQLGITSESFESTLYSKNSWFKVLNQGNVVTVTYRTIEGNLNQFQVKRIG